MIFTQNFENLPQISGHRIAIPRANTGHLPNLCLTQTTEESEIDYCKCIAPKFNLTDTLIDIGIKY